MGAILGRMFDHHIWANLRLIDACDGVEDRVLDATLPGMVGSIREMWVHIVINDQHYLSSLTQSPPSPPITSGAGFPGFGAIREALTTSGEALGRIAVRLTADEPVTGIHEGEPFSIPSSVFLTQAIHHATEHRADIKAVLTSQGIEPPVIDMWTFTGL
ncbi:MAG: DinB family protein [Thermomicrobiales bacterium]